MGDYDIMIFFPRNDGSAVDRFKPSEIVKLVSSFDLCSSVAPSFRGRHLPAPGVYVKEGGNMNFYNPDVTSDLDALELHMKDIATMRGKI